MVLFWRECPISSLVLNGSEEFRCFMDMMKAFDLVEHSLLFRKLIKNLFDIHQDAPLLLCDANSKCSMEW